jgi:hypothetical protein
MIAKSHGSWFRITNSANCRSSTLCCSQNVYCVQAKLNTEDVEAAQSTLTVKAAELQTAEQRLAEQKAAASKARHAAVEAGKQLEQAKSRLDVKEAETVRPTYLVLCLFLPRFLTLCVSITTQMQHNHTMEQNLCVVISRQPRWQTSCVQSRLSRTAVGCSVPERLIKLADMRVIADVYQQ